MMKYATETGTGNHGMDADLDSIEEDTLPGTSKTPSNQLVAAIRRLADRSNQDENATEVTAPTGQSTIDLSKNTQLVKNDGLSSVSRGSLSSMMDGTHEGNKMSLNKKIAYIMENGQPFCNHCESYYIPKSLGVTACTYCGCKQPNNDHGKQDSNFSRVEGETVADEVGGKDIIKQESRTINLNTTDDYVKLFNSKIATDSDNYYRGYNDALNGRELDEDLALLSDDYYNGYEDRKYYNKTPQESIGQSLYDIKPNSNGLPRSYDSDLTPGKVDAGPITLTDGQGLASVARKLQFPIDVIENFFEI
jgi:hypothetical protein